MGIRMNQFTDLPEGATLLDAPSGYSDMPVGASVVEEGPSITTDEVSAPVGSAIDTGDEKSEDKVDKSLLASVIETGSDASRGMISGAIMGWDDETYGFFKSLLAEGGELIGVGEEADFSDRYTMHRDAAREALKKARERSPVATGIGEVTGTLASFAVPGGALAKGVGLAGKAALGTGKTATAATKLGQASTLGAAHGAAYGAGTSEADTTEGVLSDAETMAGLGAAIPVAASAAAPVARGAYKLASPVIARTLEAGSRAAGIPSIQANFPNAILESLPIGVKSANTAIRNKLASAIPKTQRGTIGRFEQVDRSTLPWRERAKDRIKGGALSTFKDVGQLGGIGAATGLDLGLSSVFGAEGVSGFGGLAAAALAKNRGRAMSAAAKRIRDPKQIANDIKAIPGGSANVDTWKQRMAVAEGKGSQALQAASYLAMQDPELRQAMGISLNPDD